MANFHFTASCEHNHNHVDSKYAAFIPVILFDGDTEYFGVQVGRSLRLDKVDSEKVAWDIAKEAFKNADEAIGFTVFGEYHA